jgi:hypothetical protein
MDQTLDGMPVVPEFLEINQGLDVFSIAIDVLISGRNSILWLFDTTVD